MKRKPFFIFFTAGMLALSGSGTILAQNAQTDQDDEGVLEEVIVTGVRYSMTAAVEIKRESMEIVDSIVAEDLGKFPDNNVVEAMQRIPGVQVTDRGAGEVSSVSIRGLSDVTTTINGRNIFTAAGRQVALADIPATLVNRVDVYKTRSANQISRGLAGQIDVHTNRPFDFEGFKLSAQARTTYQEQTEEFDPNVAVLISNRWETGSGEFGALFNASYAKTNWKDQGVHAGASVPFRTLDHPYDPLARMWPDNPATAWTPGLDRGQPSNAGATLDLSGEEFLHGRDAMFQPHVTGERERPAWNASFQWAPNDSSEYMFEMFYNGYRNKQHNGLFFTFVDWWVGQDLGAVDIYPGTNVIKSRNVDFPFSFVSGDVLQAETDSYVYALGGEWDFSDNLTVRSELVYQDSEYKDEFFAMRMNRWSGYYPGSHYNLDIDFNQGNGVPFVEFNDDPNTAVDESDATDPAQWELAQLYDNGSKDKGDAFTWTADADWDVDWAAVQTISFGARYDNRAAQQDAYTGGDRGCWAVATCAGSTYETFPGLVGTITNHFDGQANVLTSWAIPTQKGLLSNQEAIRTAWGNDAYPAAGNKVYDNQFNVDETLMEAYIQADFLFDLGVNSYIDGRVGLRWVDQQTDMSFPDGEGGIAKDDNSNSTVLPSLMVRWGITNDLMARFSYTEVFELPSFTQLSPYIQYFPDVTDIGYGTAAGGNPDLKPIESENWDISLEWYFTEGSVLYGTYFRRDISNNIVGFRNAVQYDDPDDDPDRGMYTYILSQPDNAGKSTLDGWEFGLTWFPELPGWFNGLGIQASYTMLDSEQEIPVTDNEGNITEYDILPIGGVSEDSYSLILAYDRDTFNMRLSYFWRDDFYSRNEAALFANPLQVWKGEEESLDFQATWNMTDRWTMTFDARNLTDPIFNENYGNNPQIFNFLNHYYSRTYSLGLRFQM